MNQRVQGVRLPVGFSASGIGCGIKKNGKKDLALIFSELKCHAAACFTTNKIKAAPLQVSARHLAKTPPQAVVINSGNANCMTGRKGLESASFVASSVSAALGLRACEVFVSSTGIIGKILPAEKIVKGLPLLIDKLSPTGIKDAAQAILTTDTFAKIVTRKFKLGSSQATIVGIAKGAGMIAPAMKSGTMLAYILTDAAVDPMALKSFFSLAVDRSFNSITIDGCMSTNDTALILANGGAGNKALDGKGDDSRVFFNALSEVSLDLAKLIVLDGEGATKFIEVKVQGAADEKEARGFALKVAESSLFKCAMFGEDPNWGRVAAALGSFGVVLHPEKLDISLNGRMVLRKGSPVELKVAGLLKPKNIFLSIDLHSGDGEARVYTSDLSYEYVRINAEYN